MLLERFGILFLPQMLGIELDEPIAVTKGDMANIFPNDPMAQTDLSVSPGVLDRERDFATFRVAGELHPHAIEAALAEAWGPVAEIDADFGKLLKTVKYKLSWTLDYAVNTRTGMPQNMVYRRHVDVHVDGEDHTVEESVRMRVLDCSQKANASFCAASLVEKMERFSQSAELNQQILDLFRNDDFAKAKALAHESLAAVPDTMGAHYVLGQIARFDDRHDEALDHYRIAMSDFVDEPWAYVGCGRVFKALGRYEAALAEVDTCLMLRPDHASAFLLRGDTLKELKQYDQARQAYDRVIVLSGKEFDHRARGMLNVETDHLEDAICDFEKAREIDPEDMTNVAWLSRARFLQENTDQALVLQREVISAEPENPTHRFRLGIYRLAVDEWKKGLKEMDSAKQTAWEGVEQEMLDDFRAALRQNPRLQKKRSVMDALYEVMAFHGCPGRN